MAAGTSNVLFSSGVSGGNFQSMAPNNGFGRSACQYDASFALNPAGLGSVNFRANDQLHPCPGHRQVYPFSHYSRRERVPEIPTPAFPG